MTSTPPSTPSPTSSAHTTTSAPDASSVAESLPSNSLARADLIIDIALAATLLGREAARAGGVDQSTTTWSALTELAEAPLRLGELARRIGISQPAASALLQNLKSQGRIETTDDETDGRAKLLSLTAQGRIELGGWRTRAAESLAQGLGELSPTDDEALRRALKIVTHARGHIEKT